MAETVEELVVKLQADTSDMRRDLAALQKSVDSGSKQMQNSLKQLGDNGSDSFISLKNVAETALGFISGQAVIGAFKAVTSAAAGLFNTLISDGIKAAQESEDATNDLNSALARNGNFSKDAAESLALMASRLQATSKFSDDAVISAAALLENITGLNSQALIPATKTTANFAAAMKLDLATAAGIVGKALEGNVGALKKYGIEVQEGRNKAETMANVMAKLNERFSGAAAAELKTFTGSTSQLTAQFGDFSEEIGFVFTQNSALIAVVNALTQEFQHMGEWVKNNRAFLQQLVADGIALVAEAIPYLVDAIDGMNSAFEHSAKFVNFLRDAYGALSGASQEERDEIAMQTLAIEKASLKRQESIATLRDYAVTIKDKIVAAAQEGARSQDEMNKSLAVQSEVAAKSKEGIVQLTQAQIELGKEGQKYAEQLTSFSEQEKTRSEKAKLDLEAKRISIEEYHAIVLQMQIDQQMKEQAALDAAFQQKLILEDQYNAASAALRQKAAILKQKEDDDQTKREMTTWGERKANINSTLSAISSLQSAKSKEMAAVGKAAAIAQATMATYEAAPKAFASLAWIPIVGPALGAAASAAVIAAGLANVAKISGVPLQGGIDSVPGVGTQDNFPAVLAPRERVVPAETNRDLTEFLKNKEGGTVVNNMIHVNIGGNVFDRRETGMAIIDALNEVGFSTGAVVVGR